MPAHKPAHLLRLFRLYGPASPTGILVKHFLNTRAAPPTCVPRYAYRYLPHPCLFQFWFLRALTLAPLLLHSLPAFCAVARAPNTTYPAASCRPHGIRYSRYQPTCLHLYRHPSPSDNAKPYRPYALRTYIGDMVGDDIPAAGVLGLDGERTSWHFAPPLTAVRTLVKLHTAPYRQPRGCLHYLFSWLGVAEPRTTAFYYA